MDEISKLLDEEIKAQVEALSDVAMGSEEMSNAVVDLERLYKLRIEEEKLECDMTKEANRLAKEENHLRSEGIEKSLEREKQRKDRFFKAIITAVEVGAPLIFYGVWMRRGFKFEQTGSYTSTTFRNLFNRFKPTRK